MIFNETAFGEYREKHPGQRYFQALRNFLMVERIEVVFPEDEELVREDTYYWVDER